MRRGPGLVALDRSARSAQQFYSLSNELGESQLAELKEQVEQFSTSLRAFASAHRQEIYKDPHFRQTFQRMCSSIGVDPLAGHPPTRFGISRLGKLGNMWNDLLGLSDWNCELGVQIVDVCVSTRTQNGGLIGLPALKRGVIALRYGKHSAENESMISDNDILRSIEALRPLGCGYEVVPINGRPMVRTVPKELSEDAQILLTYMAAQAPHDHLGIPYIPAPSGTHWCEEIKWDTSRAQCVVETMLLVDGMLWVDRVGSQRRYYSPSLLPD